MNEKVSSNITQILSSFNLYISIYENESWVRTATTEEIKSAFKLSIFIEKTINHFITINTIEEFSDTLLAWQRKNNQTEQTANFFKFACNHLLRKFFTSFYVSDKTLDVGVRMYTSLLPRDRLEDFLNKIILDVGILEAVSEYFQLNHTQEHAKELEFRLKLNYWSKHCLKKDALVAEINAHLSSYEIKTKLGLLIGILSLNDVRENENFVQNLILEAILQKMLDRSILSKTFWFTLCKEIDVKYICVVCTKYSSFLERLLNFLVYIGSMMEQIQFGAISIWKASDNISLCPEITYYDLLNIVECLDKTESLKNFIQNRLIDAKNNTELLLWDDIIAFLNK